MIGIFTGLIAYLASRSQGVRSFAQRVAQKVSQRGETLIKSFEGFRPTAYKDIAGNWTIGYGILLGRGSPLIGGGSISEEQGAAMLRDYINRSVDPVISRYVRVPLTQNQYDALASWLYNFGEKRFKTSTLLKKLNARDYRGAADQFLRWDKATIDGTLQPVRGLTIRRGKERALFLA